MAGLHVRHQIRDAFKAVLLGLPTTGSRVFTGQALPLEGETELPGLVITATASEGGEQAEVDSFGPAVKLARRLSVTVIGYAVGDVIENQLDQIALEVEQAVFADWETGQRLKALCREVALVNTLTVVEQLNTVVGEVRVTFLVEYRTVRSAPQTAV